MKRLLFSFLGAALVVPSLAHADSVDVVLDSFRLSIASGDALIFERFLDTAKNPAGLSPAGVDWLRLRDGTDPPDPRLFFDLNDVLSDLTKFNSIPPYALSIRNYNGMAFSGAAFPDSREMFVWANFDKGAGEASPVLEPHLLSVLIIVAALICLGQRPVHPKSRK